MPRHALILCNGEAPSRALCRRLAREADMIIAADGGANIARRYAIRPHVIIGDLDSVSSETQRFFSTSSILYVSDQDSTDLEKALTFTAGQRIPRATVVGATGKRLDFTLGNLSVLWAYTAFIDLTFVGDGWKAMPVGRKRTVVARKGTTVSLIPFGACSGITLRGLKYPLRNASLNVGEIAVSNVVQRSPFSVQVKRGRMLLVILAGERQPDHGRT